MRAEKMLTLLLSLFIFLYPVTVSAADSNNSNDAIRTTTWLTFRWDPVTVNTDGTPCDDLAGYALYRSSVNNDWEILTGKEKAYRVITLVTAGNQGEYACWCKDPGTWFWMIRAFDKTEQFSTRSNIVECFVDVTLPGAVIDFNVTTPGDINNDGNVDGKDLSILSGNFGGGTKAMIMRKHYE